MKETPILFNTEMVQAILDGRKTQTRRIVKPKKGDTILSYEGGMSKIGPEEHFGKHIFITMEVEIVSHGPYGQPGDRLWVKETFFNDADYGETPIYIYKASSPNFPMGSCPWKPSIHMPRSASRILLEITSVRVERLNDISEEDAIAEGVLKDIEWETGWDTKMLYRDYRREGESAPVNSARSSFATLWESTYGAGAWSANPWVWVIEFKRIDHE